MRRMPRTHECAQHPLLTALIAITFLGVAVAPLALAGPNGGGTLIVHDTGYQFSWNEEFVWPPPISSCDLVDNECMVGQTYPGRSPTWQVLAAFPGGSSPRLKALAFGEHVSDNLYILGGFLPDPAADFEIPQDGWPAADGGGIGISYGFVKTELVCEVYRFWGYAYYSGESFAVTPHPVQESIFVDDSFPPLVDPIAGFSSLGFGVPGETACPGQVGACCSPDGSCTVQGEASCVASGGSFQGIGVPCDPDPCGPVPTQETSWGRIKATDW